MLNFSFAPGFSEHMIHVRGSLAAATVDFERNTYLLHRHTPAGLDFDRYHMTVSEAKTLKSQARGTLARVIYSKLRPTGGSPYGQSIARAMQSFYANPGDSLDARLSPELGRDVVHTCVEIGRQMAGTHAAWPASGTNGTAPTVHRRGLGGSRAPSRDPGSGCHRIHRSGAGPAAPRRGTSHPGAGPQPWPAARRAEGTRRLTWSWGTYPGALISLRHLKGIDCVYHLARPNVKTWQEWTEHEIEATRRVAEACLTAKVGRLIYTGTIDSYYAGAKAGTITEETPLDPHIDWRNYYAGQRPSRSKS